MLSGKGLFVFRSGVAFFVISLSPEIAVVVSFVAYQDYESDDQDYSQDRPEYYPGKCGIVRFLKTGRICGGRAGVRIDLRRRRKNILF